MKLIKFVNPMFRFSNCLNRRLYNAALISSNNAIFVRSLTTRRLENLDESELSLREKMLIRRPNIQKFRRPPFVKNMFLGKFDTNLLAFPEILEHEHLGEVEKFVQTLNESFQKLDSSRIEADRKIPNYIFEDFKDLGLFGRSVPLNYGGMGLTHTECVRLNEVIGLDWSVGAVFIAHEFVTQAIMQLGTEKQKNELLPDLISGNKLAVLCAYETECGNDISSVKTTAELSPDGHFTLNGTKNWVTNADQAKLFLVVAQNKVEAGGVNLFLVDRESRGVQITPVIDKTSLCGSNIAVVHFQNVSIPQENVLGKHGEGVMNVFKLYDNIRFGIGTLTFGVLKTFLDHIILYTINAERLDKSLTEYQFVSKRLANVLQMIYAMESMAYYTAGIYDTSENPDCTLENAILKVFNTEGTKYCLRELMAAIGCLTFSKDSQIEKFYRDAQAIALFEMPNDLVKLYIGMSGCQYAGSKTASDIEKNRNPFFNPKYNLLRYFKLKAIMRKKFRYDQDIAGFLHPSSVAQGNKLEECVQLFSLAVDNVLTIHGKEALEHQCDVMKLSEMIIEIYAMTAVLTRSSRAYCIGLKNGDQEMIIAHSFCYGALERFNKAFDESVKGVYHNNDRNELIIGEQAVFHKGYFPVNPMKHNF